MLFYLDNWMSVDPNASDAAHAAQPGGGRVGQRPRDVLQMPQQRRRSRRTAPRGLNENYARELMELHTLGVDGGYTQKDVTEVARAFTGWTIDNPRQGGGVPVRRRAARRPARRSCWATRITAGGGIDDGEQVLDILARIRRRRASSRQAGAPVRQRHAAAGARRSHGGADSARPTATCARSCATLLTSPEFLSPDAYRAKVKTPLEFVVSAVRATGRRDGDARPLVRAMQQLGHAALSVPAADRLQGHGRRVDEHRRARDPHELRADARDEPAARDLGTDHGAPRQRRRLRIGARAATSSDSHARDDRESARRRSADGWRSTLGSPEFQRRLSRMVS